MFDSRRQRRSATTLAAAALPLLLPSVAWSIVLTPDADTDKASQRTDVMQSAVVLCYTRLRVVGGSAVVVGPKVVLTARHGVTGWKADQLWIDPRTEDGTPVRVARVVKHPDKRVDLAVLHLAEPINVPAATLVDRPSKNGERVWLGGYGIFGQPGKPAGVGRFRSGYNRIDAIAGGRARIRLSRGADGPQALPAAMDSGSPVFVETPEGWRLSGITVTATSIFGPDYGDRSHHQLLAPQRDWLRKEIGANSATSPPATPLAASEDRDAPAR